MTHPESELATESIGTQARRCRTRALAGLGALALFGAVSPAAAQPHSFCTFDSVASFDPGVGPGTPGSGTFESKSGRAVCVGAMTGTGVLTYRGQFGPGDTCDAGMGSGTFAFTVGDGRHEGTFTYVRVGILSTFRGAFADGGTIFGLTQTFATEGDCVTTPVTEAYVLDQTEIR